MSSRGETEMMDGVTDAVARSLAFISNRRQGEGPVAYADSGARSLAVAKDKQPTSVAPKDRRAFGLRSHTSLEARVLSSSTHHVR